MKILCFYNFLEDIIFLKLALLPIYYQCPKWLQSVGDAAETIHIHILIVPEHFGGGVADETQLVLVGGRHILKQRGKGMAAAVGRVAGTNDAVALLHGIVKADGVQSGVKCCPVVSETQASAGGADKHRTGGTTAHQPVNDGLDLGRDRDDTAAARLRLSAANKAPQSGA